MISQVVKKDGGKEPFDVEKIKKAIESAAREAEIAPERVQEVVDIVTRSVMKTLEGREDVPTSEIRERILTALGSVEPPVSTAWNRYDKEEKGSA